MKKFTKIMLMIAGICFLSGSAIAVAASAMGGRIYGTAGQRGDTAAVRMEVVEPERAVGSVPETAADQNEGRHDEHHSQNGASKALPEATVQNSGTASGIRELKISVQAGAIRISQDESVDTIEVRNISEHIDVIKEQEDNCLELVFRKKRGLNHIFTNDQIYAEVILPAGSQFTEVSLEADAGAILVDEVKSGKLSLEVGAGAVTLNGDVSRELDVECDAGAVDVQLTGEMEDYNYELQTTVGGIEIDGQAFGGLNQRKTMRYDGAEKYAQLECDAGAIALRFAD